MTRQNLTPSSALPLVYFGWAHVGLAAGLIMLVANPAIPGGYFLHPRMAAVVHLVTVAWVSGSILGAFYVVGPLALGLPLPVRRGDWIVCVAFIGGTVGLVWHLWIGRYGGIAWSGLSVLSAVAWLGSRTALGLRRASAPWPVLLHVMLAFANMLLAAGLGIAIGLDRTYGLFELQPIAAAFAHVHLASIGWPMMMVVGLAYRLVPMFLPARMPTGNVLATSAFLIESGLAVTVAALLSGSRMLPVGGVLICGGLGVFVRNMRRVVGQRLPRPPALPRRDWSTWQTHVAFVWLLAAAGIGLVLTTPWPHRRVELAWIYGAAGLVGFMAQIVVGIQGRLVPLYAYYRAMTARGGLPPERAANELPTAVFARPVFVLWTIGVPGLTWGLAAGSESVVRAASVVLLGGVCAGAAYLLHLMRVARQPRSI